jgi:hypothetical protein
VVTDEGGLKAINVTPRKPKGCTWIIRVG